MEISNGWTMYRRMIGAIVLAAAFAGLSNADIAGASPGGLVPFGQLTASSNTANLWTVIASGPTAVATDAETGAVDVFAEPPAGWSSGPQAATLEIPSAAGTPGGSELSATIAGPEIVIGDPLATVNGTLAGAAFVYLEPAGGWSGQVQPSAELIPSNGFNPGDFGTSVAISGSTVFVGGNDPTNIVQHNVTRGLVYVFNQPTGGWSGTLTESARLSGSSRAALSFEPRLAASGSTLFVDGLSSDMLGSRVAVFTRPPHGWASSSHPSAELSAPGGALSIVPLASAGTTLFVAGIAVPETPLSTAQRVYVFRAPRRGWSGSIGPSAVLVPEAPDGFGAGNESLAASTSDVAFSQTMCFNVTACEARTSVFTRPAGGWNGTWFEKPELASLAATRVALSGQTLFGIGPTTIGLASPDVTLYRIAGSSQVEAPALTHPAITGVATGNPRLRLTIDPTAASPRLIALKVTLPTALRLSRSHLRLAAGLSIAGVRTYQVRVHSGQLTIVLSRPARGLTLSIGTPALAEGVALERRATLLARYNAHHRRKRTLSLSLVVSPVDAASNTMPLSVTLTLTPM